MPGRAGIARTTCGRSGRCDSPARANRQAGPEATTQDSAAVPLIRNSGDGVSALNVVVFQKNGIGVNVTSVLKSGICARLQEDDIPIPIARSVGE